MDLNKLLDEAQRNRATRWNKLKWFWLGRCLKCGGKLVVGYWRGGDNGPYSLFDDYYESPKCEWCSELLVPPEDRIYKTNYQRQVIIILILLFVFLLITVGLL